MAAGGPEIRVNATEKLDKLGIPGPEEVSGDRVQVLQGIR
jgi:hypothetical protein